ncbi:OmpA family protein [Methylobacter sp. sgz302048]|uniref:OmpA family protein n=1 Tax=Methylobacter sp. sgz302048 TaxID=3455945 RepID=UPI003FA15A62
MQTQDENKKQTAQMHELSVKTDAGIANKNGKVKTRLLALALSGMSIVSVAQADDTQDYDSTVDKRWYVAPFGTFIKTGGDRAAKDGWGGGMGFGKMLNEHFNIELRGFYQGFGGYSNPTTGQGGRWDLTGGSADLQYYFFRDKFSPYAVVGLGGMNTSVLGDSGASITGETGVGFTYELHDNFLIRSDVRYRYNNNFNAHLLPGTDEYHDMTVNVGFVMPFGAKPRSAVKSEIPVAPPVAAVPDCSTQDSDGDGVNNCQDKCPDTMKGSKIDFNGCPMSIELKGVNFEHNSAQLTENAKTVLDGVAANLIATSDKKDIEVQGHTSSEGTSAYNMKLSQKRSQAVAKYLKSKGVTNKLYAKGYGEDFPVADNSTEEGKAQNRRVELIWIGD